MPRSWITWNQSLGVVLLTASCGVSSNSPQEPKPMVSPEAVFQANQLEEDSQSLAAPVGLCSSASEWVAQAELYETNGQREEAMRLLRRCLGTVGGPPSAWRFLASLETDNGQIEQARRTLLKAVEQNANDSLLWTALARIEARKGQGALALDAYDRAYRINPQNEFLRRERVRAKSRFGSLAQKREARLAPLMAEANGRLDLGDTEGALQTLGTASALVIDDSEALARIELKRAAIYLSANQISESRHAVNRGLEHLKSEKGQTRLRADLHVIYAELALKEARNKDAAKAASLALSLVPAHPFAAVNHGLAALQMGRKKRAISDFRLALESGVSRHISKESFLDLPGISELTTKDRAFKEYIDKFWDESSL